MTSQPQVPRVAFATLGCKVNQSETDLLTRQFSAAGCRTVPFDSEADVYVMNTCTVTHVADKKSRQVIGRARRANPEALIVATGCYASVFPGQVRDGRTLVVRNRDKAKLVELVLGRLRVETPEPSGFAEIEKYVAQQGASERSRPMVKAQDGCDSHCAYCIIPRARGRSRSVPGDDVVRRVQALVAEGHAEVVLTGVDLGSYGEDGAADRNLGDLIRRVLDETDVPRLRISSLEPGDFDQSWLSLWENPRLCRHLHVPLQSGSSPVLLRMERKYSTDEFEQMIRTCRQAILGVTITSDIMVGFPGESDAEFEDGLRFIEQIEFDGLHVFKYSIRSGTLAAAMAGQVDERVKNERSSIVRREGAEGAVRLLDRHVGLFCSVVWEETRDGLARGLTDTDVRVYGGSVCARERLSTVELQGRFQDGLWGEPQAHEVPLPLLA